MSAFPLERAAREAAPRVLAALVRRGQAFAEAEDALQEALLAAAAEWPAAGAPTNPAGWLYRVALRRLADLRASEDARRAREAEVGAALADPAEAPLHDDGDDDTLELLFMCCHRALTPPSAIALTLRAVGGLTTAEIASAFLVPEATMAQRISRAKASIAADPVSGQRIDGVRLGIVAVILAAAIGANVAINTKGGDLAGAFPWI
ncbi:MAG: sigma factor-like helix-turn-helix DNA-binding protein, partial [Planctomycetota bacterium]